MVKRVLRHYTVPAVISVVLCTLFFFFRHGIPLLGVPDVEDVIRVEILDRNVSEEPRGIENEEKMELAVKLINLLNVQFGEAPKGEPVVTVTYYLKDGRDAVVSVNEETVYWKGKAYRIKGDNGETFLNLAEGVFFHDVKAGP